MMTWITVLVLSDNSIGRTSFLTIWKDFSLLLNTSFTYLALVDICIFSLKTFRFLSSFIYFPLLAYNENNLSKLFLSFVVC